MKDKITRLAILIVLTFIATKAFPAQFLFTPRTSVNETYTDNLFLTEDNKDDDFITDVSAGFTAQLLGKTSGLELSADPGYVWYQEYTDNDTWRLPANMRAYVSPSKRTMIEFVDNFIRTEDPVEEDQLRSEKGQVEQVGDTTVRRGREPYYRNTAALRGSYQFGEEDKVYASLLYGLLRNDDDQVENNDEYRASAGLDYWFVYRFGSQLFSEYTRGKYDQQSGFVGEGSSDFDNYLGSLRLLGRVTPHFSLFTQYEQVVRDFTSGNDNDYIVYAPSAGFQYNISKDAYMSLGLGYYWQNIDNEKNQNDPFFNGEISKTWSYRRGFINLTGLAGLTQNDFGAQNQGFQQFGAVQGSAQYNFTRRIVGDTGAYYRYSFTPGRSTDVGDQEDQTDNRFQFNAGIGFIATRWMNIRLGYAFNYYNSDADNTDDYNENRALLTITLQPDQPWRF